MDIIHTTTNRGFQIYQFSDLYNVKCSIQKSSLADKDAIWVGPDCANPRYFVSGKGWVNLEIPRNTIFDTRMHLDQDGVKSILDILSRFSETGEI